MGLGSTSNIIACLEVANHNGSLRPSMHLRANEGKIVFRCWKDRVAYDENKYLAALAKRGSPLNSTLMAATATKV